MPGQIILKVTAGPMKGSQFEFDQHDTLIVGRRKKVCHLRLGKDPRISRHHFILETNPPDVSIRDFGSLNGTFVNGEKIGKRQRKEKPEDAAKKSYRQVSLNHNDVIRAGDTEIRVSVIVPLYCDSCGVEIESNGEASRVDQVRQWCEECRVEHMTTPRIATIIEVPRCQKCDRDVSEEIGARRGGEYVCQDCQEQLEEDPLELIKKLMSQAADDAQAKALEAIKGYDIGDQLGAGGMGAVYRAKRVTDGQSVAIKVMLSKVAVDPRSKSQFLREVQTTKTLSHKNVVRFLDCGSGGSAFYLVMECCNGGCLNTILKKHRKLSCEKFGKWMVQILRGLAHAHKKGFVHRDLKPANILIHRTEESSIAKVSDFGLAKHFQSAGLSGMTATGNFAGTYPYMPREQLTNYKYVNPVSDVWSISATFYRVLTGHFVRDMPRDIDPVEAVLTCPCVPILERDSSVPKNLARVLDIALAVDPKDRYPNAGEFAKHIQSALRKDGVV